MKLKTLNYNLKYYLPKIGKFEAIIGTQGMHQTNENFGEELLIPDATTNDLGFLQPQITSGEEVLFKQEFVMIIVRLLQSKWNRRRRGYFKAIDEQFQCL